MAGSAQLTYTESGDDYTDVTRFMTKNDSYLDEIHSLRNQYDADVCVLLVNTLNSNGRVPDYAIGAERYNAFFVVKASAAANYYSFPHELGHLLGCRHEEDTSSSEPYANAHGYYWNGKLLYNASHYYPYKTIMCVDEKYYRVQYFSNPYVYDEDNNPMGTVNYYYSAFAIDDYASIIGSFAPHYTSSGTLEENEWWRGTVAISGNVTVPSNITLTIEAGTQIYLNQGANIVVNGTLNAAGTSSNRIIFTRSGSTGVWGGIQFNPGSSGNISYANISYASQGIYINGTNTMTVNNCEINNCSGPGIYFYDASYNSTPIISNCSIHDNTTSTGIVMYYSSPVITGCNIYNNYNGLGIADLSDPSLGYTNVQGNNNIHNNANIGVYSLRYSSPLLGINSSPFQGGNNIIASNTFRDAQAETYCYVYAENNWWGSTPPDANKIVAFSGSVIDYNPWLTSPPSFSLITSEPVVDSRVTGNIVRTALSDNEIQPGITLTTDKFNDEEPAYSIYKLKLLWNQAKKTDLNSFKNYLRDLTEKKERKMINAIAALILSGYEKDKKISILNEIISEYDEPAIIEAALMNKFLYYFNELKRYEEATAVMNELGMKYPTSSAYNEAKEHFRILNLLNNYATEEYEAQRTRNDKASLDQEIYLGNNYPNPFNPITTIRYRIPKDGIISLKIYNLLGEKVAELVNGYQKAGEYGVSFDASRLASGVYIYKLVGNNVNISKKMILMK